MDGRGSLAPVETCQARLAEAGLAACALEIASLAEPWEAPADPEWRRFKSGCAPILALDRAQALLGAGEVEAVIIRGEELLRSGYTPAERRARMAIWPGCSIPMAYTELAREWMALHGVDAAGFRRLADALLASYQVTALRRGLEPASAASRAHFVTDLYTLADCAHPEVDFTGAVLLGTDRAAEVLGLPSLPAVRLRAVAVELAPDGPEHAAHLASYPHLTRALGRLEALAGPALAGVSLAARLREGQSLLEAYTCFPVVPLGFLLAAGVVSSVEELAPWLVGHEITVTGGMNLARAPWNNPVLHALAVMSDRLIAGGPSMGVLHGNGGLGGLQGLALLERSEP